MGETTVTRLIKAPRRAVYEALLDREAVAQWLHPDGMSCRVQAFEPREGGGFRISLTYQEPGLAAAGKTEGATDTFEGRFVRLVPDEQVVEAIEFESADTSFAGTMTLTVSLEDAEGGTRLTWHHANVPPGIRPEDNEKGTRMTLDNLARLLEEGERWRSRSNG